MSLFTRRPCAACVAKDDASARERALYTAENAYLRDQVKRLQDRLLELADPGINRRVAAAVPPPPKPVQAPAGSDLARDVARRLEEADADKFVALPSL